MDGGFDGFYTYFPHRGFTYGSDPFNWSRMTKFARTHKLVFSPSIGPGYNDSGIRPWNDYHAKDRENGRYFDDSWNHALNTHSKLITITSYNEWGEGTQIESAMEKNVLDSEGNIIHRYQDYSPLKPDYYMKRLKYWIDHFKKFRAPRKKKGKSEL